MSAGFGRALGLALDLICPASCASCLAPGGLVCPSCLATLDVTPRRASPSPCPPGFPPTWSVADYAGVARDLLLAYKERSAIGLGRPLALRLATAVRSATGDHPGAVVLVPVPSSVAAVRERGDDVVAVLARMAARALRRDGRSAWALPALRQRRSVADSAGLPATDRLTNLDHALLVRPGAAARLAGRYVVLIDDLVTTGATLTEAARAMQAAGVSVAAAATVAMTRRRSS